MPQNRQYYRKVKYPDKVAKPKRLVFVRIFLFCSVGIKIQYFPTAPSPFYGCHFPTAPFNVLNKEKKRVIYSAYLRHDTLN